MKSLQKLLELYRKEVEEYVKKNGRIMYIDIALTPSFLLTCEQRIVEGHKKYGNDWKTKDCLMERELENYDHFNYTILDLCQKKFKEGK